VRKSEIEWDKDIIIDIKMWGKKEGIEKSRKELK